MVIEYENSLLNICSIHYGISQIPDLPFRLLSAKRNDDFYLS